MSDTTDASMADVIERFRRASHDAPEWSTPSDGTWNAISTSLDFASTTSPSSPSSSTPTPSRRSLFTGFGGLVVGAVLGAGGLRLAQKANEPRGVAIKRATLTPLQKEDVRLGIAELRPLDVGYSLAVDVPEGAENPGGYVEVWLINIDGIRMVSVGVFAAGSAATFFVSDALIEAGYLIVDLSNEEFDNESRHSGDTIMRGELRT
ncbi:hypothetical protein [Tessaracoccus sp.]